MDNSDSESEDKEWQDAAADLDDVFGGRTGVQRDAKPAQTTTRTTPTTAPTTAKPKAVAIKKIDSLAEAELKFTAQMDAFVKLVVTKLHDGRKVTVKRPGPKFVDFLSDQLAPEKFSISDWDKLRDRVKKQITLRKSEELEEKKRKLLEEEAAEAAKKKKEAEEAGETYIDDEDFYAQFE